MQHLWLSCVAEMKDDLVIGWLLQEAPG